MKLSKYTTRILCAVIFIFIALAANRCFAIESQEVVVFDEAGCRLVKKTTPKTAPVKRKPTVAASAPAAAPSAPTVTVRKAKPKRKILFVKDIPDEYRLDCDEGEPPFSILPPAPPFTPVPPEALEGPPSDSPPPETFYTLPPPFVPPGVAEGPPCDCFAPPYAVFPPFLPPIYATPPPIVVLPPPVGTIPSPVPEPGEWALLVVGFAVMVAFRKGMR